MYKKILILATVVILLPLSTQAREDKFVPAVGEISAVVVGMERAVVSAEGGLNVYSAQGKPLSGFPLFVDNQVFATSPVLADIAGDEQQEIVVVARSGDSYTLFAFDGTGATLGSVAWNGASIYFDQVALPNTVTGFDDIIVADTAGKIVRYSFQNGNFSVAQTINTGLAVGLAVSTDKNNLILNFPTQNGVKKYGWQGDSLVLQKTIAVAHKFIYPIKDSGQGIWYGVNFAGALVGFNAQTGSVMAGFPVNNANMPVSGPEVVQYDASNPSAQITLPLAGGKSVVVTDKGETIGTIKEERSLANNNIPTVDENNTGIISGVSNYGIKVVNKLKDYTLSVWSRIGQVLTIGNPEIEVKVDGYVVVSNSTLDLGSYVAGEQISFKVRVENKGNGNLSLNGVTPIELQGDAVNFCQVTAQPMATVGARGFKEATVVCQYADAGDNAVDLKISSNDQDENPYLLSLKLKTINNKVQDGTMETVGVGKWGAYGAPTTLEKSTTIFKNGKQSLHIAGAGFQQRFVAVEAGKIYRLSLNYRIVSGQFKNWLGINTSNGDFENRLVVLSDTGAWYAYTREFKVPANFVGDFRLVSSIIGGEVYVDDMIIYEIPNFTTVADGDMEYPGTDRWLKYGTPTVFQKSTTVYFGGKRSLRVSAVSGGFQQKFLVVEAGKNYRLSLNYKLTNGTMSVKLGNNSSNADFENKGATFSKTGQWLNYVREFKVPNNFVGDFRLVGNVVAGEAYVDDVKIEEVLPSIIIDGDMELPTAGAWMDYGQVISIKEKSTVEKHSGNNSLHIKTGVPGTVSVNGVQQFGINNTVLIPGKSYKLSFWYKNISGTFIPRLGDHDSDHDFFFVPAQWPKQDGPTNGWQLYERVFVAPANPSNDFRVVFVMVNNSTKDGIYVKLDNAEVYVDEVKIELVE